MWMDGVILYSLVVLGIARLLAAQRLHSTVIPQRLAFITNYTIGFMVAIFAALTFGWHWAIQHQPQYLRKISLFVIGSHFSGKLAAVVLIPTYTAQRASRLSSAGAAFSFMPLYSQLALPSCYFPGSFNLAQLSNGLELLYMGKLGLLGASFYFLARTIPVRER